LLRVFAGGRHRAASVETFFHFGIDIFLISVHIHIKMTKELNLNSMENCVCFNLRWVSRAFSQFFVSELNQHGLLPTQTPILGLLAAKTNASMAEVSDWLAMDRTTLVRNLRPLERDGLIKAVGKGRGNKVSLALTAKADGDATARAQANPFSWPIAVPKIVCQNQRMAEVGKRMKSNMGSTPSGHRCVRTCGSGCRTGQGGSGSRAAR